MHLDIRWVTTVAEDVGRDFPGHWNGLGRNMAHPEFYFRKLILW